MKILSLTICLLALTMAICFSADVDKYRGHPVTPDMSPDDANDYITQTIKMWLAQKLPDRSPRLQPQELLTFAKAFQNVGVTNLIAAYAKTAPAHSQTFTGFDPEIANKRAVLDKALSLTATSADIPAILQAYDASPLILNVLYDHAEWDSDIQVTDFVGSHLDNLQDAYKADGASILLYMAVRSPNSGIQSKLESVLTDVTDNDQRYQNLHLYDDLLLIYGTTGSKQIAGHIPGILAVLANRAKPHNNSESDSDSLAVVTPRDVLTRLTWISVRCPAFANNCSAGITSLFSDEKSKDAVKKLVRTQQNSEDAPDFSELVPSAASGDKNALAKLVAIYQDPNSYTGGGEMRSSPGFYHDFIARYLKTVVSEAEGDPLKNVLYHVNSAVYDPATSTWTIPKEDSAAGSTGGP